MQALTKKNWNIVDNPKTNLSDRQNTSSQAVAFARLSATRIGADRPRVNIKAQGGGFYFYIFNFDGVIANTLPLYQQAIRLAASSVDMPPLDMSPSVLCQADSLDSHGIADAFKVPTQFRAQFCTRLEANLQSLLWRCTCFEGIPQLLSTLSSRGYTAIISRNQSHIIEMILHNYTIRSNVHRIIGSEQPGTMDEKLEQLLAQYKVSPEKAIYCGDSVRDIKFAHLHGMRSAACTWGWQPQLVASCDATFVAHRTGQLLTQLLAPAGLEPDVAI